MIVFGGLELEQRAHASPILLKKLQRLHIAGGIPRRVSWTAATAVVFWLHLTKRRQGRYLLLLLQPACYRLIPREPSSRARDNFDYATP